MGYYNCLQHDWCRPKAGRWHWIDLVTPAEGEYYGSFDIPSSVRTVCGLKMTLDERTQDFARKPRKGRCLRCQTAYRAESRQAAARDYPSL